jgi:hypothetical protein
MALRWFIPVVFEIHIYRVKLTVKTQLVYVGFLSVCQSDYMFRPQLGHHQVTSKLYDTKERARLAPSIISYNLLVTR